MLDYHLAFTHDRIKDISRKYGTPFYLYNLEKIRFQFLSLKKSLPNSFKIHYALKANSNLSICHALSALGARADVSSLGELFCADKSGFTGDFTLLTGSGKTEELLATAMKKGVKLIVIESVNEAKRLNKVYKNHDLRQDVIVRINPLKKELFGEVSISDYASKFGIDEECALEALLEISQMNHLNLIGIHVYTASNVVDYLEMLESMEKTIEIANRLRSQGLSIQVVDFGGGLGVAYDRSQNYFDLDRFAIGVKRLVQNSIYQYQYIFEIGRYIVAESACYVCKVVDLKQSRGKNYVIVDGGIHHLYRPLMKKANQLLEVIRKNGASHNNADGKLTISDVNESQKFTLAGLLPTPADILIEDVPMELPEIGDLVTIYKCGAYSYNHSLTNFALHPYPAELAYQDSEISLIRERGLASDFARNQIMLMPKIETTYLES